MQRGMWALLAVAMAAICAWLLLTRQPAPTVNVPPEVKAVLDKEAGTSEQVAPAYLSDLRWAAANTGWVALADDNLPRLDTSFTNTPISIAGKAYEKGLGTFPLSEISYSLDGSFDLFEAEVGVDDAVPAGKGSVIFKLFLDNVLAFDSGVLRSGDAAVPVAVPLAGAGTLKLVVEDAGDGSSLDYSDWADARLSSVRSDRFLAKSRGIDIRRLREDSLQKQREDWAAVEARSSSEVDTVSRILNGIPRTTDSVAAFDPDHHLIVLANDKLAITLGYGGDHHGLLSITNLESRTLMAVDTSPSLSFADTHSVVLSNDTQPLAEDGYRFRRVEDPALGTGMEIEADFLVPGSDVSITPSITLFDGNGFLTYSITLRGLDEEMGVRRFSFFNLDGPGLFVAGEEAGYVTDYSLIRRAEVRDDSIVRKELVGLGKPLLLYDRARGQRFLMAILDEVSDPAQFSIRLDSGKVCAGLGFEFLLPEDARSTRLQSSPRLFIQATGRGNLRDATYGYRNAMAALHPPPPIPEWVKYQWGTWYAFGMNYDDATVRAQIDYIARNLSDLGPWSILLDAGWYVAEGRPGSTWKVDEDKFPEGLRAVVDYAHSKGIKVVLYFSAPYLDDREREGNWLGLSGFIEEHPDWVIRLQTDSTGSSYVYDFTNPALVEYMRELIAGFFRDYDVDGIKIDGLGQAEGEQLAVEERDTFGDVNKIRMFTMDIYRLVWEEASKAGKDVYVESGWSIPAYANQYAHTFRYADEFPALEHRYPAPGLLEHIDYAAQQKRLLGQRPNMGMVWGGPESQEMIRLWFEAALAMASQMTVSTDLTRLSGRELSAFRAVLAHYNAFQGDTHFVGMPVPGSFGTTVNSITYLGVVNREEDDRTVTIKLADYGLPETGDFLLYDVSAGHYSRVQGSFQATLPGPGFKLFLLRSIPGVVWTNSSLETAAQGDSLRLSVTGPRGIGGMTQVYAPTLSSVWLDGKELSRSSNPAVRESYSYDASTGVLRLRYRHDRPHDIEIRY